MDVDRDLMCGLVDLSGDDVPELVIAHKFDSGGNGYGTSGSVATYRPYDLYAIQDGKPIRLLNGLGSHQVCYFMQDGTVVVTRTSSGDDVRYYTDYYTDYYTLPAGAGALTPAGTIESGSGAMRYCDEHGMWRDISSDEMKQIMEQHPVDQINESIEWVSIFDAGKLGIEVDTAAAEQAERPADSSPTVTQAQGYNFSIPAYWEGRVDVASYFSFLSAAFKSVLGWRTIVAPCHHQGNGGHDETRTLQEDAFRQGRRKHRGSS